MPFQKGNTFGKGRPKGAKNKPRTVAFMEEDQRLAPARRFRGLASLIARDLGGAENLSTGEKQLIRRAAMISVECERIEKVALQEGAAFDAITYGTLTGHLTRALRVLGLKQMPREESTPTLQQYLDARRQGDGAFAVEEEPAE
jgi:hypothetical protein